MFKNLFFLFSLKVEVNFSTLFAASFEAKNQTSRFTISLCCNWFVNNRSFNGFTFYHISPQRNHQLTCEGDNCGSPATSFLSQTVCPFFHQPAFFLPAIPQPSTFHSHFSQTFTPGFADSLISFHCSAGIWTWCQFEKCGKLFSRGKTMKISDFPRQMS